ncbi:MAG: tetratricopeptide repeat protein [Candidatus Parabeggiatoa sp.]|nr:tetratricopeptide repeat protein [Candidatus Parabeggiatoa sp.]
MQLFKWLKEKFGIGTQAIEDKDISEVYQKGFTAFQNKELDKALLCFSEAVKICPDHAFSWEMLGCTLGNLNSYEESLHAFNRLHELDHECPNCWYNTWIAYRKLGHAHDGLKALERSLELKEENHQGWFERGLLLGGFLGTSDPKSVAFNGQHEEAVYSFDKALDQEPQYYEALVYKGIVLYQLTHAAQVRARLMMNADREVMWSEYLDYFQQSRTAFEKAISIRPDDPMAWFHKGNILVDLECNTEHDEAAYLAFSKVTEIETSNAEAWYKLAEVCLRLGNKSQALTSLERAISLDDEFVEEAELDFTELSNDKEFQRILERT